MADLFRAYGWIVILVALIIFWTISGFISSRRKRAANARLVTIAAICGQHGMSRVDDNATLFVPQMLAVGAARSHNSFATPDWSLWFSELRDDQPRTDKQELDTFAVLLFTAEGLNIPYVAVARKGVVNMPTYVGGTRESVGLESIDFNDRFRIQADDRRAAVMLVDQGMMQWLLDLDLVSFQISGPLVRAIVKEGRKPEAIAAEMDLLFRFRDGFAAHIPQLTLSEYPAPAGMAAAALQAMRVAPDMLSSLLRGGTIRQT